MQEQNLSQAAKDFGYEEQKQTKIQMPQNQQSTIDLPQAIITAASALGKDNQQIQHLLHDNKLQLIEAMVDDNTYLQLNDIKDGDSIPLYHIASNQPLTQVEEAARSFDRLGNKEMYNALMVEAAKAGNWEDTVL